MKVEVIIIEKLKDIPFLLEEFKILYLVPLATESGPTKYILVYSS